MGCRDNYTAAKDPGASVLSRVKVCTSPMGISPLTPVRREFCRESILTWLFSVPVLKPFHYLVLKAYSSLYHLQCLYPSPGTFLFFKTRWLRYFGKIKTLRWAQLKASPLETWRLQNSVRTKGAKTGRAGKARQRA